MNAAWIAVLLAGWVAAAAGPAPVSSVLDFGARADGKTNDAGAIRKAVEACAKAGGGTVYFPPGDYLSGTIVLRSNVTLHLAAGATLWGSRDMADYDPPHLIFASEAENVGVEGAGAIDGNGAAFWDAEFRPRERRPSPLAEFVKCRNVRIRDVRIRNAPGWTIHPLECDGVRIQGISIVNPMRGPNTDGIDPDSSRNVFISDSYIEAGDDCIVLKTTGRAGRPVRPCENVTVTNCTLVSDDAALKLGTESLGDFRHCLFSNCAIRGSRVGLAIYAKDGGVFEAVSFSNITIETRGARGVEWPIFVDLEKRAEESRQSRVRDINFSDIIVHTGGRVLVGGMPEQPLENFTFRNLLLRVTGQSAVARTRKPRGSSRVRPVGPEQDYASVPSALIFANLRGLALRGVRVVWDTEGVTEDWHALYAALVEDLRVEGFSARQSSPQGSLAAVGLDSVRDGFLTGNRAEPGTITFLGLRRISPGELTITGNDLRRARHESQTGAVHVHLR